MSDKAGAPVGATVKTEYKPQKKSIAYRIVKRTGDIVVSAAALIVLALPMLAVAIAIAAEDGAPVIYRQERVGKGRKRFYIYKFRSMRRDADKIHEELRRRYGSDEVSFKLKDSEDPRITRVGRFIRRLNIDELPQLVNILKGEMSLVGPRPLPVYEYVDEQKQYGDKYAGRYDVQQGLTCYWQISDRSMTSFDERMQMDADYAAKASIGVDLRLIFKTVLYTVTGRAGYDSSKK